MARVHTTSRVHGQMKGQGAWCRVHGHTRQVQEHVHCAWTRGMYEYIVEYCRVHGHGGWTGCMDRMLGQVALTMQWLGECQVAVRSAT